MAVATGVTPALAGFPPRQNLLSVMGFSCGTCRMGSDSATSVVSLEGRCHELANLWIVGASIFQGCSAVEPGCRWWRIPYGLVK
jgi:hypothetical protein